MASKEKKIGVQSKSSGYWQTKYFNIIVYPFYLLPVFFFFYSSFVYSQFIFECCLAGLVEKIVQTASHRLIGYSIYVQWNTLEVNIFSQSYFVFLYIFVIFKINPCLKTTHFFFGSEVLALSRIHCKDMYKIL